MRHKSVCMNCEVEFQVFTNECVVVEMFGEDPTPYKLWNADVHICPECGFRIVDGFADVPFAVHYDADFEKKFNDVMNGGKYVVFDFERSSQRARWCDKWASEGSGDPTEATA